MNEQERNERGVRRPPSETSGIRLLVLDIDGTIVDEANRVRESVSHAIHSAQRRGVAVALASGRLFQTALHPYEAIGCTLPLICFEGALIREPNTGFVHRHWPLEPDVAAQMLDYAKELTPTSDLSIHFHIQDRVYVSHVNDASIEYFEKSKIEPNVV